MGGSKVVHYSGVDIPVPFIGSPFFKLWPPLLKMVKEVGPHDEAVETSKNGNFVRTTVTYTHYLEPCPHPKGIGHQLGGSSSVETAKLLQVFTG